MPEATYLSMRQRFHIDLERASGTKAHVLPVPSVFVIGTDGRIKFVYANPDYKVRLEPAKVLQAAKEAQ